MSDDFNRIQGIGYPLQHWLIEQGISTYAGLAGADPHWIVEQWSKIGEIPISLEKIQSWMQAAKLLAVKPSQNVTAPVAAEDEWVEFASFYISCQHKRLFTQLGTQVTYRTYADHIEGNDNQLWHGIAGDELCAWIMQQVENRVNDHHMEAALAVATANIPNEIGIESIRVHDDIGGVATAGVGEIFKGAISAYQSLFFDFNLVYHVLADNAKPSTGAWACKLSLYIHERLGDKLVLKREKICHPTLSFGQTYSVEVMLTPALPPGIYRIRAIATLLTKTPSLSVVNIPLLQIS